MWDCYSCCETICQSVSRPSSSCLFSSFSTMPTTFAITLRWETSFFTVTRLHLSWSEYCTRWITATKRLPGHRYGCWEGLFCFDTGSTTARIAWALCPDILPMVACHWGRLPDTLESGVCQVCNMYAVWQWLRAVQQACSMPSCPHTTR